MQYYVITFPGSHEGYVVEMNTEDIWSNENPGGWTYNQICGSHGNIHGEYSTREKAEEVLDKWLECDSKEKGTYCYAHNPNPA